jgi:hypothetical protein
MLPTSRAAVLNPPLLNKSPIINASKQKPITSIRRSERCLIFDKTAMSIELILNSVCENTIIYLIIAVQP